ncbi:MAG TPA: SDR family oxidoreductase [Caulobacteraceae bacterium]|jgi:NAD(P)-dependent dehydrogenase (short-subunit alcohol dehydrogenase family)
MSPLNRKRVVVIGGTAGIGQAVAKGAVEEGAEVVVASSSQVNVDAAAQRIGAKGEVIDVRDEDSIAAFFDTLPGLDHLVFTAGDWGPDFMTPRPVETIDRALVDQRLSVRFFGALLCIKHARAKLSDTGSVTLTDGVMVHRPIKGQVLTAAFGGATEHLARGLAVDMAPIRVNAVCPGLVLTERIAGWPPEMLKQMTANQLIQRPAQVEEVAEAYLHLMRAGYTTGQVLIVDGGRLLM